MKFRKPNLIESLSLIIVLLGFIVISVQADISILPALIISIAWAMFIGWRCGYSYQALMDAVYDRLRGVMEVVFIVLCIGMFISSMIYSGTIPTIIYYLIEILQPTLLIVLTFVITTIVSILIGTSWGTAGTVGVVMISIAQSMGVSLPIVAGAVASGAHVGQLLSPMSDTSNTLASLADTDTMTMIRRMAHYTIPVILLSLIGYSILGFVNAPVGGDLQNVELIRTEIKSVFNVNPIVILPMVLIFYMTFRKKPIIETLTLASLLGILFGILFNGFAFTKGLDAIFSGFSLETTTGISASSYSDVFLNLVNRGGISSMVSAALLVLIATIYGSILTKIQAVDVIANTLFAKVKTRTALTASSITVSGLVIAITSTSFLASMMSKDLFTEKFKAAGMDELDLVSSAGTASTQFLTLIPWCDTAVFLAALTGVPTIDALPYNFFCWGCALMAILLSIFGFGFKNGKRIGKFE